MVNKKHKVLDHGFVKLIDYMGDDQRIVDAARVSTDKIKSSNEELIYRMMKDGHKTPFEHVELEFHLKVPMWVGEYFLRYRTASPNKKSGRYSVMDEEFYVPDMHDTRLKNKLPSSFINRVCIQADNAFNTYKDFISEGHKRELSRIVLPANTYTEMYWKINLLNLFNFIEQRLHKAAQKEIQYYAKVIADIVAELFPTSWKAFEEYRLYAKTLSRTQTEKLREMLSGDQLEVLGIA